MESDLTIGVTIRKARLNKNISLRKLAKILEISHTNLLRIETNVIKPNLLILMKLALYLDLDEVKLLKLTGYSTKDILIIYGRNYRKVGIENGR